MNSLSDISSISRTEKSSGSESYTNTNSSATDNQIKEKLPTLKSKCISVERFSNKKKKIIIITIITILILIIITMTATMISLFKSNNKINQASTSMNNANVYTISSEPTLVTTTTTIYDIGGGGISGGPPCSSYTVINDPSRNVGTSGMGGACDDGPLFNTSIGGRWIRFMGTGGTIIPSSSPGMQHCSAYLAGWSNVTLPSTAQTIVNGTACFDAVIARCAFEIPMTVINCVTFYVYFLSPVSFCNARYCTI